MEVFDQVSKHLIHGWTCAKHVLGKLWNFGTTQIAAEKKGINSSCPHSPFPTLERAILVFLLHTLPGTADEADDRKSLSHFAQMISRGVWIPSWRWAVTWPAFGLHSFHHVGMDHSHKTAWYMVGTFGWSNGVKGCQNQNPNALPHCNALEQWHSYYSTLKISIELCWIPEHLTNGEAHGIRWERLRTVEILKVTWCFFLLIGSTTNPQKYSFGCLHVHP